MVDDVDINQDLFDELEAVPDQRHYELPRHAVHRMAALLAGEKVIYTESDIELDRDDLASGRLLVVTEHRFIFGAATNRRARAIRARRRSMFEPGPAHF